MASLISDRFSTKYDNSAEFNTTSTASSAGDYQSLSAASNSKKQVNMQPPFNTMSCSFDQSQHHQSKHQQSHQRNNDETSVSLNGFTNYGLKTQLLPFNSNKTTTSENVIIDTLTSNNYRQQLDLLDELIVRGQVSIDTLISFSNLDEFYCSLGSLLLNTSNNDVQKACLRFLQVYFKSIDKLKSRSNPHNIATRNSTNELKSRLSALDSSICDLLVPYLIQASVSPKLQLKQLSIDLIYSYMKLTSNFNELLVKFIKSGVESSDSTFAKSFIEPALCILLTDEFSGCDYTLLIKSLLKQMQNPMLEQSAMRCLSKIEKIVGQENFDDYMSKISVSFRNLYLNSKHRKQNLINADGEKSM
jgi:hypothetical protein